jgi:DNA-binding GntR family transcriptional regulator
MVNEPTQRKSPKPAKAVSKIDVYERIYQAVVEHRLMPGTKLSEERVAELFSVSRTQVRGALVRLAAEQLVTVYPNRGAFVTTPTADEARDVLGVRKTLEPAVVVRLIERIAEGKAPGAVKELRALVNREQQTLAAGDRRTSVRLSGEFHILLAQLSGSSIMTRMMRELTPLTCLANLTFEAPALSACPNLDHIMIIDAIEAGKPKVAMAVMVDHLQHIEESLVLRNEEKTEMDLAKAFFG